MLTWPADVIIEFSRKITRLLFYYWHGFRGRNKIHQQWPWLIVPVLAQLFWEHLVCFQDTHFAELCSNWFICCTAIGHCAPCSFSCDLFIEDLFKNFFLETSLSHSVNPYYFNLDTELNYPSVQKEQGYLKELPDSPFPSLSLILVKFA